MSLPNSLSWDPWTWNLWEEKKEESKVKAIEETQCPTLNSVEEKTQWDGI